STAIVPRLPPSRPTDRNTPNVCMENVTVAGIDIHEHIAMTAAHWAIMAISFVSTLFTVFGSVVTVYAFAASLASLLFS
ncbi:MAG: hypothetical protein IKX72_03365, partial [Oscillospiraceae bacterium]|nr:hypothetical protein [Oscillospiraceae bacterium]